VTRPRIVITLLAVAALGLAGWRMHEDMSTRRIASVRVAGLSAALALVAACALAIHALRRDAPCALLLCGAALGVGLGIKIFALPVATIGGLTVAALALARDRGGWTLATTGAGAGLLVLAAAPWFVGTWLRTGYPLSPMPVEVAGITLGRANPSLLWYMDRPATGGHLELVEHVKPDSRSHAMLDRMTKDTAASKLTPEAVAAKVHEVITSEKKPLRVPMDRARVLGVVKRLAPQSVIDRMIGGLLGG